MTTILGLIVLYTWIHGIVIIFRKTQNLTPYEKVVLCAGFAGALLFVIGTVGNA